jgi:hypothetical protein
MNEIATLLGLTAAVMIGVLILAVVVKMREVKAARTWQTARGKITRSEVRAKKVNDTNRRGQKTVNYPAVTYEFSIKGRRYTGERISLAEIIPESEIEPTLERYPLGAEVTVYYNPSNPNQSVLERDPPVDLWEGLRGVFLFFGGGAVLVVLWAGKVPELVAPYLPNPENALFATLAAGMGLFLLLVGFVQHHQALAMQTWTSAPGTVLSAEIYSYTQWKDGVQRRYYAPRVTYRYTVNGRQYEGDRLNLAGESAWNRPGLAERKLQKYPVDAPITVYYNPKAPAEAVLERYITDALLIWSLALGLFALSAWSAGMM